MEAARTGGFEEALRRLFDVAVAFIALALLSPLLFLAALLVKFSSAGPVLFRQERVGRGGRHFHLYKFRSMRVTHGGPVVTAGNDSRVTGIGRLLRKTKLDELPQLVNVLKGEMSLVGPRPEVPKYVACYTPEHREVLSVRPGMTGLCQIEFLNEEAMLAGRSDVEDYYVQSILPQKLAIDLRYVRERSLQLDVSIIARTIAALLRSGSPRDRISP